VFPSVNSSLNDSTWYDLWFVIDNNAETFKLYIGGGNFTGITQILTLPGSFNSTPETEAGIFSFRNQATEGPLTALKALIRTGARCYAPIYVDDLFWSSKALLSLPGAGSCANNFTLSVAIKPNVDPVFPIAGQVALCQNATPLQLPTTSNNGISGTWSPAAISNQNSGSYTFTPAPGTCGNSKTINATILPLPVVAIIKDTTVFDGTSLPQTIINSSVVNSTFTWQNSNPAIGLPGSGTGNIPAFTAVNQTNNPISGTITINPTAANCSGNSISYKITVLPLTKDIYIPNLFSPNGDGKNDMLFVYGNYIEKMEVHIFNQWGEKIITLRDKKQGWDGKHKGKQQPVGVYVYTARIVLRDGQTLNKKGSVTLYR
jgi:gliding motility-associated-like protein